MDSIQSPVVILTPEECREHLAVAELGRIVTNVGEVIDIFPVNYVLDGDEIVFRTAEGSKLLELTINDEVLFQVDDHSETDAWSVVVRGTARRLETNDEVDRADRLPLRPWIPTLKHNYVSITPHELTGRAFHRAQEPDRGGVQLY